MNKVFAVDVRKVCRVDRWSSLGAGMVTKGFVKIPCSSVSHLIDCWLCRSCMAFRWAAGPLLVELMRGEPATSWTHLLKWFSSLVWYQLSFKISGTVFGHGVTRSVMAISYFMDILARVEHSCLLMARSLVGSTLYGIFCVTYLTCWESVPKPSALWAWVKELHPPLP